VASWKIEGERMDLRGRGLSRSRWRSPMISVLAVAALLARAGTAGAQTSGQQANDTSTEVSPREAAGRGSPVFVGEAELRLRDMGVEDDAPAARGSRPDRRITADAGHGGMNRAQIRSYPLERAVRIALQSNRQLRVAQLDLEAANRQVKEAYGGLFPEIDANASMQRNLIVPEVFLPAGILNPNAPDPEELVPVAFGADNQWSAGVTLSQKVFDAKVFIGVGAANKVRDLNREALRGNAQQVATNIRIAYVNVLLAREQVRVTRNSIRRVERTLEETRALNRAGLAGNYDVLRLEVQLSNIRPNLRRGENALAEAERLLAIEMGLSEVEAIGAEGELHLMDLERREENSPENVELLDFAGLGGAEDISLAELRDLALRNRSDLRQADVRRELEEVQLKVERSELFPRMEAFANWSVLAQENGALDFFGENSNQRTKTAAVGVRVEVPIFKGGSRWQRVAQRRISVRQAEEQIVELKQRAENEVHSVLDQLTESRVRADAQRRAVGEAQRGFEIVTAEYLAGTGERLEVTEAELALRQAELNYARAVYDYLVARARLDLAVGVVPVVDRTSPHMAPGHTPATGEAGADRGPGATDSSGNNDERRDY
jgi:outer membrane protein TolC